MVLPILDIHSKHLSIRADYRFIRPFVKYFEPKQHFPQEDMRWLLFLHYLYYPYPDHNPLFNLPEIDKRERIKKMLDLPVEEPQLVAEMEPYVREIYETPAYRIYITAKKTIDKINHFLDNVVIDKTNLKLVLEYMKNYEELIKTYKSSMKELMEEQNKRARGNARQAWDIE